VNHRLLAKLHRSADDSPYLSKDVLRAARAYREAVAELVRLTRSGASIEEASQSVVGAGLRYRQVLERCAMHHPGRALDAAWTALAMMHTVLHCVHIAYNRTARTRRNLQRSQVSIELARQAVARSRSMSWRTLS
jgi:hypothetical protein